MNPASVTGGNEPVLELTGIGKRFGDALAVQGVSFTVVSGRIHALVGENGAGKSTLVKIMSGVLRPDRGEIRLDGQPVTFGSPRDAAERGIHLVHQELALLPESSVAANVFLGSERRGRGGFLDWAGMERETRAILDQLGVAVAPRARVGALPVAKRQMVEIARALIGRVRVLILDEPTAALAPADAERLFAVVRQLRDNGAGIVYISHRLAEVAALADEVTVLKDGHLVTTRPAETLPVEETVRLMVGRPIADLFPPRAAAPATDTPLLDVEGLTDPPSLWDIDLALRPGELVGVAGLQGQGQDRLLACLAGDGRPASGRLRQRGHVVPWADVAATVRRGVGLVPEDRKSQGLLLDQSSFRNIALPALTSLSRLGWVRRPAERQLGQEAASAVGVRGNLDAPTGSLSGGNQQKVVLAKWLAVGSRVLLLNQPTRGVDVGAKAEIYGLLRDFANQGGAALVISQELTEVLGLCDRILVMRGGRIVAELAPTAGEEAIMTAAVGA